MMKEIVSDTNLVAYCGLYCGACSSYTREGHKVTFCTKT